MAVSKSSSQTSLAELAKQAQQSKKANDINSASDLNNKINTELPTETPLKEEEVIVEEASTKSDETKEVSLPSEGPGEKKIDDLFELTALKPMESDTSSPKELKEDPAPKPKLFKEEHEIKSVKVGYIITPTAKENVTLFTKKCGYRSANDFVNDLFENLEVFLS